MENAAEDERSLLKAIKKSLGFFFIDRRIAQCIYPYTSYILKSVIAFRLDDLKMTETLAGKSSNENAIAELNMDFNQYDFRDISKILKEIEKASSVEMDEHKFALFLPKVVTQNHTMNFILVLASFAVSHGVWLLVLSFIAADSNKEDIMIVLKRVEGLFTTLRRNLGKEEAENPLYLYVYISLLSSTVTRRPSDNWESIGPLYNLINAMFEVTSVAHMFLRDVRKYTGKEVGNLMLLSIYWVTRGVISCSSACSNLPKNGYIIQDPLNLKYIHEKLVSILERFQMHNEIKKRYMEDVKLVNAYQIPNNMGEDNYYALMALFGLQPDGSEDIKLLHCGKKKNDVSLMTLKRNSLVLIISGLNISSHEIDFFKDIHAMTSFQQTDCAFIWLPIYSGSWITSLDEKFNKLVQMMPWYTVQHPTTISEGTKGFIREIWKFHRKPIAVVLNRFGDVVCPNAVHTMRVWGPKGFPFTRMRERTLWTDLMRLYPRNFLTHYLVSGFEFNPHISNLFKDSKCVILYGGNDTLWIQKFTTCIREASADSRTSLGMICIPKNEEIHETISTLLFADKQPQIHFLLDLKQIWYFWTRLESLLISRHFAISESEYLGDPIIQQVEEFLCYSSVESWACLIKLSSDGFINHSLGDLMLQAFMEPNVRTHLTSKDFTKILQNYMKNQREMQSGDYPYSRIVLNIDNKDAVQQLECPHCKSFMEKKIRYRCCHVECELN